MSVNVCGRPNRHHAQVVCARRCRVHLVLRHPQQRLQLRLHGRAFAEGWDGSFVAQRGVAALRGGGATRTYTDQTRSHTTSLPIVAGITQYVNGKTSPVVVMSALIRAITAIRAVSASRTWRVDRCSLSRARASGAGFYPLQSIMVPILSTLFLGTDFHASDAITGAVIVVGLGILITGRYLESNVKPGTETATPLLPSDAPATAPDGASGSTSRGEQTSLIAAVARSGGYYNSAAVAGGGAATGVELSTLAPADGGSRGFGAQPGAGGAGGVSEWGATSGSRAGGAARGSGPIM